MAIKRDDSYYKEVEPPIIGGEASWSQIPDNGVTWIIDNIETIAPGSNNGWVAVIWDYEGASEEVLFFSYGSSSKRINRTIIGDGIKKLAIVLYNISAIPLYLGGSYEARELE